MVKRSKRWLLATVAVLCSVLVIGCSTLDRRQVRIPSGALTNPQSAETALQDLLDPGFRVLQVAQGSPSSARGRVFAVVGVPGDEVAAREGPPERNYRELIVLVQVDGELFEAYPIGRKALAPYGWDEFFPDSLVEVGLSSEGLLLQHYGGGRQRWSREDRFVLDPWTDQWLLDRVELTYTDTQHPDEVLESWTLDRNQFGTVPLEDFDIRKRPGTHE